MLDETSRNIIINKSTGNFKKHFLFRKCFPERCIHLKELIIRKLEMFGLFYKPYELLLMFAKVKFGALTRKQSISPNDNHSELTNLTRRSLGPL